MVKRRRKGTSPLKNFLVPHRGNDYKPMLFTAGSVAVIALILLFVEAGYVFDTKVAFNKSNFLASVLPGVLASLTNDDRAASNIATLAPDPLLAQAAQLKANDMAAKGYFSHVAPDGKTPWYWLDQVAYPYTYAGENLAVNFTDSKDVEEAWMKSPTHHANIVKQQYTRIGIGVAQGQYQGKDTTFVVQFFATPQAGTAIAKETLPSTGKNTQVATSQKAGAIVIHDVSSSSPSHVLGAEIEPPLSAMGRIQVFFGQVATAPSHTMTYLLAAFAALIGFLLLIAIAVHARVQYLEVIIGGLLLLLGALGLMVYNATSGEHGAQMPSDTQSAAVGLL